MSERSTGRNSKSAKKSPLRETVEWIVVIEIAVIFAVLINKFILVNAIIPSASMETTIMTGDRIFGNRLAYRDMGPKRGDIVIFKFPDDESQLFIKRVIGLPGETVELKDGVVYIDGRAIDEPYIKDTPTGDYGPVTVPGDSYFMLGDNRDHSADSRFWTNTFVHRDKILGKAFVRYFPFDAISLIE